MAARLPLKWLHYAGAALGWFIYGLSPSYAALFKENLYASGGCPDFRTRRALLRRAIAETGKGVTELIVMWFGADDRASRLVTCDTWRVAEKPRMKAEG